MILLNQSIEFHFPGQRPTEAEIGTLLEQVGRTCWKSEDKICEGSWEGFNKRIMGRNHTSVLEHVQFTVKIVTDRAIANELVRHRIAAYTQESTRYVDYDKRGHCKFIIPLRLGDLMKPGEYTAWDLPPKAPPGEFDAWNFAQYLLGCERMYKFELADGGKPEHARDVLPLCTATELWATYNIRMWRHVIMLRAARSAHPKIQWLLKSAHAQLNEWYPTFFSDLKPI